MIETPHNYWLWVTRREIAYRSRLTENKRVAWTCDEKTNDGDLIFLYLNSKGESVKGYHKSAFCYLIQAKSDAYPGERHPGWREQGRKWGCECQVLYEFRNPVKFKDLKQRDSEFKEWDAYKKNNFQGTSFEIPEDIWNKLDQMASERNPGYPGHRTPIEMPLSSIESTVEADLNSILAEEELGSSLFHVGMT